jgi:hypothetical protein
MPIGLRFYIFLFFFKKLHPRQMALANLKHSTANCCFRFYKSQNFLATENNNPIHE